MDVVAESIFFQTGGTLPADAPSYLARDADQKLLDALLGHEFCYLLNSRQMGKSSLCVQTQQRLRERGVRTAYLEMSAIGGANSGPANWYATLTDRIGHELGLRRDFAQLRRDSADRTPVSWLFTALEEIALTRSDEPIVVFLDEIDTVRSLPFAADEFFGAMRALYNRRAQNPALKRLSFCLVGSATQADLIADTRLSPFNIGRQIDLRDFTPAEAAPLAAGLAGNGRNGASLLERAYHWTGGHPFLTQSVCSRIAEDAAIRTPADIDSLVSEMFFATSARRNNVHLADVANRMLTRKTGEIDPADDTQKASILALYEQVWRGKRVVDDERDPLVGLLKLSGILRVESGALRVRNRIYERVFGLDWITESRPDAEARRVRAAVARTRWQIGSIAACVLLAMSALTAWALINANRAQQEARRAETQTHLATLNAETANRTAYIANANLVQQAMDVNNYALAQENLNEMDRLVKRSQSLERGYEWTYFNELMHLERREFRGHQAGVSSVAFSPDGKRILTGSHDKTARLWDAATGKQIRLFKGHQSIVFSAVFSPDGSRVLTGSDDKTARLWDAFTGKVIRQFRGHQSFVFSVCFSPDGRRVLTGSRDSTARLWDVATGKEIRQLKGQAGVNSVCFSPDGKRILTGSDDGIARLWDVSSRREIQQFKDDHGINSVCFSPDGKRILTTHWSNIARLWDVATGKEIRQLKGQAGVNSVCFSPDGRKILTGNSDRTIRLWDVSIGREIQPFKGHQAGVNSVCFSPDGKRILTGSRDKTVRLWDTSTGREIQQFKGHQRNVSSVCFSPDGRRILTGSWDNTARLWDVATGREIQRFKGHQGIDDPQEDERFQGVPIAFKGHNGVTAVCFSPDGKKILIGDWGNTAHLWDVATGKELLQIRGHQDYAYAVLVAFSPDGKKILTASTDKSLPNVRASVASLWDASTGKELQRFKGHQNYVTAVAFSPDGKRILTGSWDHTVRLWDAATGKEIQRFKGHQDNIVSVCFSPDATRVLTGSWDSTARLWDVVTGREILQFKGHSGKVTSVAFSPDGSRILTGSVDGTARIWRRMTDEQVDAFERLAKPTPGR